ncbi:O-antigen ligase family protein [Clostridium beijerinckii]|uniref:O-antigen ligase family protein n=1 Tax=Clostridium beijerinckii TaxID=1520 RepID=UPI002330C06D|nr:O-antigen ligase family protein [Clostridium beijerinckii]
MFKENKFNNIILTLTPIITFIIIFSITNKNYLVSAMYIISILTILYLIKDKSIYDLLYAILLVSTFFDYSLYIPHNEKKYIFHIVLFIFTIISLRRVFNDKSIFLKLDKKILTIYSIWFIYMCISITWALNKQLAIKYLAIYLMMFAFIIDIIIYNINKERLKQTIKLLVFLLSLVVIIGAIEVILGQQLPIKHYYYDGINVPFINVIRARPIVFSFNTNNLAATLAMLSPLFFYSIYKFDNLILKIYFFFVSCISFSLIVITTSRTGIKGIELSFALYLIYCIYSFKKTGLRGMIIPLLLIISFTFLRFNSINFMNIDSADNSTKSEANDLLLNKMDSLANEQLEVGNAGSLNIRWTIIDDVVEGILIKEKRLLGYGVGNVEQYLKTQNNTHGVFSPHCYAIEIFGDFGVVGIVLYGIYYLYLLISNIIIGIKRKSIPCIASATGLITFSITSFGPSSITYVFSYWILIAMSISCIQVYKCKSPMINIKID